MPDTPAEALDADALEAAAAAMFESEPARGIWRYGAGVRVRDYWINNARAAITAYLATASAPSEPSHDSLKDAVIEAAKAEVLARGYRSSDMARALKAHSGEFWFEEYVPEDAPERRCNYAVTTELDDGPLTQLCVLAPHGIDTPHHFAAAYDRALSTTPPEKDEP